MFYNVLNDAETADAVAPDRLPGDAATAQGGRAETRLFAEVLEPGQDAQGAARTVVLLHPTPVDHRFWDAIVPMLGPRYRIVLPDLRGHGQSSAQSLPAAASSDGAPVAITLEQLGRDMAVLLDLLEIEQAVFVGCSIGGYLLYELWRTMPERIAGLVFCSSKPQADTIAERARRTEWIAKIEAAGTAEFIETMLGALLGEQARDDEELVAKAREMMEAATPEAIIAVQRGLALRPDSRATAATISVPALEQT